MKTIINIVIVITLFIPLCLIPGCSQRPALEEMDDVSAFQYLRTRYDKGDYLEATSGLEFYTLNFSGSSLVDSAQFLLGHAHYKLKEYLLAADAFEHLYHRFPRSRFVPDAMYMVGVCYWKMSPKYSLDQDYTYRTLDALQAFIDYHPEYVDRVKDAQDLIELGRNKLAHKEYANGMIYLKMKDYEAAIIYFSSIVDRFYDTEWAPQAAFQLAVCLVRQDKREEAKSAFRDFISKYPDHPWRSRAESALNGLAVTDEG